MPEKTLAHCEEQVQEKIGKFIAIIRKKVENGSLWPFHRILNLSDGDLNVANFPNLAVAAVEYLKKYEPETYKFMVTSNMPIISGLIQKAITKDNRNIYTEKKAKALSENAIQSAKQLGLNVNKLIKSVQELAGITVEEWVRPLQSMR